MKIGIFDSGIGGLSILEKAVSCIPDAEYIYYADTEHVPYGSKSLEEIRGYCDSIVQFLISKGCEIIVIACNTATSVAASYLRARYSNIPILGIEPAVKPAVLARREGRILVIATPLTVKEEKLNDLVARVDDQHVTDMKALGRLPEFAERGEFDSPAVIDYLDNEFSDCDMSCYSEVVLGCTHFIQFVPVLRRYFKENICFIDGVEGTVRNLANKVGNIDSKGNAFSIDYYKSGRAADEKEIEFFQSVMNRIREITCAEI